VQNPSGYLAALLVTLLLFGCSEPVPMQKTEYVGDWRGQDVRLLIREDGSVDYERRHKGGNTTSIQAPIKRFEGDNFVVGFGPFNTTFAVSRPPHQDGTAWKMTVDGVELVRQGLGGGSGEEWKA
jgi:hypothetical protein